MNERCEECNGELSACGPEGPDGCPSSDCRYCKLSNLLEEAYKKIAKFETLAGVYTELLMANHALEDRAVLLLGGLIEIERIKGNPPIQVARTIATRCINACKEQITSHEPTIPDQIHGSPGDSEGPEERQAQHFPG
jgi:hypothetical protein